MDVKIGSVFAAAFSVLALALWAYLERFETKAWSNANGAGVVVLDRWQGNVQLCGPNANGSACVVIYPPLQKSTSDEVTK